MVFAFCFILARRFPVIGRVRSAAFGGICYQVVQCRVKSGACREGGVGIMLDSQRAGSNCQSLELIFVVRSTAYRDLRFVGVFLVRQVDDA